MRDSKTTSAKEYFNSRQDKVHFKNVSKDRNEENEETRKKAIEKIKDMKDNEAAMN